MKLLIGKVLCQGDSLEVAEGITLSLRQYEEPPPSVTIELDIKFCPSVLLVRIHEGFYARVVGITVRLSEATYRQSFMPR